MTKTFPPTVVTWQPEQPELGSLYILYGGSVWTILYTQSQEPRRLLVLEYPGNTCPRIDGDTLLSTPEEWL